MNPVYCGDPKPIMKFTSLVRITEGTKTPLMLITDWRLW